MVFGLGPCKTMLMSLFRANFVYLVRQIPIGSEMNSGFIVPISMVWSSYIIDLKCSSRVQVNLPIALFRLASHSNARMCCFSRIYITSLFKF